MAYKSKNHHYVSRRYYKPWTDNALRVCVLPQQYIMPFKTPAYWNDDRKKTLTSNIAVKTNYSFTEENENKITAIEESGHDIIESILKDKVLPKISGKIGQNFSLFLLKKSVEFVRI